MQHHICPQSEGVGPVGAQEGVIHQNQRTLGFGEGGDGLGYELEWGEDEERVRRGFEPDEFGSARVRVQVRGAGGDGGEEFGTGEVGHGEEIDIEGSRGGGQSG